MSKINLIDTHCHIHDSTLARAGEPDAKQQIIDAKKLGVNKFICVGTDLKSSKEAVNYAINNELCYASLAIHPHEAAVYSKDELKNDLLVLENNLKEKNKKIVAIGECGLDYFYHKKDDILEAQKELLVLHIKLAKKYDLPIIFHIRDAFEDFFRIIDDFEGIRGIVHSFSAGTKELEGILKRGLYVGLNGIITFTKQSYQLEAAKMVPADKMVLETDAPFLTPEPFRGKMCQPKHLRVTAEFLCDLRGENLEDLAKTTSDNARKLFGF